MATGLELLRKAIIERGCTKAQAESKVVAVVLDIISGGSGVYTDTAAALLRLEELNSTISVRERDLDDMKRRHDRELFRVSEKEDEVVEYIEEFEKRLQECETAEGRDAMRTAQLYVNMCNINSKYDNTAFIIGLSEILSRGGIGAIDTLKKMNPKLFEEADTYIGFGNMRARR